MHQRLRVRWRVAAALAAWGAGLLAITSHAPAPPVREFTKLRGRRSAAFLRVSV